MARRVLGAATLAVVQALDALDADPWLVACSGGADSLALAWAAGYVGRRRGTSVRALVVDHGLQSGSDAHAHGVARGLSALADPDGAPLGLSCQVARVAVHAHGEGLEAAARTARYAALDAARAAGESVLLGHTRDDQAETVLLGLARGSGGRSLAGMAEARGWVRRPLLDVTRDTTARACAELGLEPWHDPMNDDPRYARVRVRTRVLPALEAELGPGVRDALARTARLLRVDADALDALTAEVDPDAPPNCRVLAGLEPAVRTRALLAWLREQGAREVAHEHVAAVERLVTDWHGQKGVAVPGAIVRRRDGVLVAERSGR